MFNERGDVNAASLESALENLVKYAQILDGTTVPQKSCPTGLSDDYRDELADRTMYDLQEWIHQHVKMKAFW